MTSSALSSEGLRALRQAMIGHVENGSQAGLVWLVSRAGETHVEAVGAHAFDGNLPMRRGTIFRIASLTKPIAAAATMMLVEEGMLRLDEPIDRLIPELASRRVLTRLDGPLEETEPARRPILVRDLMTCEMGMGAIMMPGHFPIQVAMAAKGVAPGPYPPDAADAQAWLAQLASLPLMSHPGESWRYDTSFTVLGVLIARAADQSLEQALAQRIFEPLGMADTSFTVAPDKLHRLPACYWTNYETGVFEVFDPAGAASRFATPPGLPGAHGGLTGTIDDYFAFTTMMMNGGVAQGRRLLSEASVAAMTQDRIAPAVKARSPFGPGFWDTRGWGYGLSTIEKAVPGEPRGFGWDGGYGTSAYWDPASGVTGILLSQRLMDSPTYPALFQAFWNATYAAAGL